MSDDFPLPDHQVEQSSTQEPLMTSFPVTKRKRATRAKFAKVRTGCVTCKRRHVKCDETKPACKNCIKWAGFCGGYESIHTQTKTVVKKASITPPSPELEGTSSPEELELPLYDYGWQFQPPENLSPPESVDSQISPYGCLNCSSHSAGPYFGNPATCCATFDDTFWTLTLPHLVQDNTAIRYANLAVHALIFAKGPSPAHAGKFNGRDHYGEALICYGLALQEARQATARKTDLREAVICSMFFVIFETINGDREAAQAHLQSGQKILEELGHSSNGAEGFRKELRNVLRYLAQQAREFGVDEPNQYSGEAGGSILDKLMV